MQARTAHHASAMRVQQLLNAKMKPRTKQKVARVLVIEETGMVPTSVYNVLNIRATHGRNNTHDVCETTYNRENHNFGRVPIVIHLGDFLQVAPTASLGLTADVNEVLPDGRYKFKE